jgi:hypothetical protein
MLSMTRPSRGVRVSATTIRYIGRWFAPIRFNLIRTATLSPPHPDTDPTSRERDDTAPLALPPRLENLSHQSLGLLKLPQELVDLWYRRP